MPRCFDPVSVVCLRAVFATCLPYNVTFEPVEDFVGLISLARADAETIGTEMMTSRPMRKWGFNMEKLRGQGYDGCATMSGSVSGVKTRVMQEYPSAKYFVHCRSHQLNLVIGLVTSCKNVPVVRNFMGIAVKLSWFLVASAIRRKIVKDILKRNGTKQQSLAFDLIEQSEDFLFKSNRQFLPSLCETRWLARVDTLSFLLKHYAETVEVLEVIAHPH